MNKIEVLSQSVPRRLEVPSSRVSLPAAVGSTSSGSEEFSSVLNGFSDDVPQGEASLSSLMDQVGVTAGDLEVSAVGWLDTSDRSMGDLLQTFMQEGASEATSAQQPSTQGGNSILSALQEFLPRILVENSSRPNADTGPAGGTPLRPNALAMGSDADDVGLLTPAPPSGLKVAVKHQETHFKPIIEGFSLKADSEGKNPSEGAKSARSGPVPLGLANGIRGGMDFNLSSEDIDTKLDSGSEEQIKLKEALVERQAARTEISPRGVEQGARPENVQSLPPGMLHRIAGAVIAEGRSMATEANMHQPHLDGRAVLTSTRAADGVLRVLNLQLHPAELGVVTIKMKLAGESLEMDLQVASEETAQLLRGDADKLSSILKGAGYRPDVINITVGPPETSQTDVGSSQRQHFSSQSQHQSGAGQEGRPRQQDDQTGYETTGVRNDAREDGAPLGSRSGGIYL